MHYAFFSLIFLSLASDIIRSDLSEVLNKVKECQDMHFLASAFGFDFKGPRAEIIDNVSWISGLWQGLLQ